MANKPSRIDLFERTSVPKAIATLAIPTILSSLVMVIYNLADTYFVGMLQDPIQNAAVAFAGPVLLAFNAVNNLFGVGASSLMSRALGARDYKLVKKSSATGFYSAMFFALLISIATLCFRTPLLHLLGVNEAAYQTTSAYMFWTVILGAAPSILNVVLAYLVRAEGSSFNASIGTMSGCILNIILDPIFILPFGLNMKAAGAGLATCISNCFACCYFLVFLYRHRNTSYVSIKPAHFSFEPRIFLSIFQVGIPAAIQNLLNVTSMTLLNNLTAGYGTEAIAAMGIAQKINMIPFQITLGASQGIMPLISYNYASGNIKRLKETLFTTMKISIAVLVGATAIFFFNSPTFIQFFMKDELIVLHGSHFLQTFCLGLPFIALDFIAVGVFQATGLGQYALLFAVLRKIVLEIPALIILNKLWPLYGLACAQFTSEIILACFAVLILSRLLKKWQTKS